MNKVLPGQPQKMSASTFNTFVDAANDYQRRKMGQRAGIGRPDTKPGILTVRNLSGVDLDRFAVVGINDVAIKPEDNFDEFCCRPTLDVLTPTADHAGKFAILQEPIAAGALGLAMVSGTSVVVVNRAAGETSDEAGVVAGTYCLVAGDTGAQIVWESSYVDANGNRAAIVRFPYGGAGGGGDTPVADRMGARAAGTSKSTTLDGIAIGDGQKALILSGADIGVWQYATATGSWILLGTPPCVDVQLGATYGKMTFHLNQAEDAYEPGVGVWA